MGIGATIVSGVAVNVISDLVKLLLKELEEGTRLAIVFKNKSSRAVAYESATMFYADVQAGQSDGNASNWAEGRGPENWNAAAVIPPQHSAGWTIRALGLDAALVLAWFSVGGGAGFVIAAWGPHDGHAPKGAVYCTHDAEGKLRPTPWKTLWDGREPIEGGLHSLLADGGHDNAGIDGTDSKVRVSLSTEEHVVYFTITDD